ncbi:unnamed protein product [Blepharisma stoltei]|uniref:Dol-P-Glc:Glc(2)Man(9)GlcNAc(2)-PP-Dol alpha-1,2-glucosyltransferase n=1 Tax=Blepharisma stoltei TaxID=1481888 RepID=A0AAU9JPH3_9CILI|nr:unnamed protein product [Blepharisma stoltei]
MALLLLQVAGSILVSWKYPEPYMDEIFHIKQLGTYLNWDFATWDDKITTLPGLYIASWIILQVFPIHKFLGLVFASRLINALFGSLCWYLLRSLKDPKTSEIIMLYPPLFLSGCLYYTDNAALLSILLSYLFLKNKKNKLSALIGLFSIICRQTNIIWIGYFVLIEISAGLGPSLYQNIKTIWKQKYAIIQTYFPFIILLILFIAFLIVNKGIAVGDRENHIPVFHFTQICYLALIMALYTDYDQNLWIKALKQLKNVFLFLWLVLISLGVTYFTYEHPFIIADNTHYTFYIWKNILKPYLYIFPILFEISFIYLFFRAENSLRYFIWIFCSCVVLIPAPLLELRYFIIPIVTFLMQTKTKFSKIRILALYAINIVTLGIFVFKPYKNIGFLW